MLQPFIKKIQLDGFLSFRPNTPALNLNPLNVIIGPNGSGKSNFIEVFELLRSTPTDFASAIRSGGGAEDWVWKGSDKKGKATHIEVELGMSQDIIKPLRYSLDFDAVNTRVEILDEIIEQTEPLSGHSDRYFFYKFQKGNPVLNTRSSTSASGVERKLERASLTPDQSILAQRKDPDLYPELHWLGTQFSKIQTFREWSFGASSKVRAPQRSDIQSGQLLPDASNLALVLNEIHHHDSDAFDKAMKRFLPRYERFSVRVTGGLVQFYLHEKGIVNPISALRVSDGTLRFLAMLAALLNPTPPPVLCLEEPELGMHPDAVSLLAELLIEASTRMQLIVTTHSDTLLSALSERVESVLVCENNGNGTNLEHLDANRLEFWLKKYKLGEIWRLGELGGNP